MTRLCLLLYSVLLIVGMPGLHAQTGSIAGKVSGAQGQAVVGATVTVSSGEDGLKLGSASSGADGKYYLSGIRYGRYRVSAAMPGYAQSSIESVTLAAESVKVDFSLQPNGIVGDESDALSFRASGVEGATAPSGYSAAASAEDTAAVVTHISTVEDGSMSLEPVAAAVPDCIHESDLIGAAHSHPESFDSMRQLGIFYFEHGDMKQSIAYLDQASAIQPLGVDDARRLALAYIRTNQFSKAIAAMQAMVDRNPGDPTPMLRLAQVYQATDDRPRAIAHYVAAARLNKGTDNVFACGMGLLSLGAVEQALELFSAATGIHSVSARLWVGLGIAQSLSDRRDESAHSLLRAADLDPEYMPTWFFLAGLPGSPTAIDDEIRDRLAALVVSHAGSAEAHYDYAVALWRHLRRTPSPQLRDQVETQLRLAIAGDPAFAAAHFQLGMVYEQAGNYRLAAAELEQAVRLDPSNAAAHYRLAQAYRRTHRAALADPELKKFEALQSRQPQQAETMEAGLRAYTEQLTRPQQSRLECHNTR